MFISPVINTILLLAFTYFVTSLIISAINEAISGIFRLRPMHLKEGLENLFFDEKWKNYVSTEFLKNPFIESLLRNKEKFPTYIPSKNFAHAILAECNLDVNHLDASSVIAAIDGAKNLPQKMKDVVKGYVQTEKVSVKDLQSNLESFYDKMMERVNGWYTRLIRRIVFYLSLAMAISLNIDTFKIVTDGLSDKERLEHAADGIAQQIAAINKNGSMSVQMDGRTVEVKTETEPALGIDSSKTFKEVSERLKKEQARINDVKIIYKNTTGYALGYENWDAFTDEWVAYKIGEHHWLDINWAKFWKKLIGIIITAFALQLGSNYWFGVLNKVVSIRAAGTKPKENGEE